MRYIDTHTHLDFPEFDHDRDAVLEACSLGGVKRLVVLGVTQTNWSRVWQLVESDNRLVAALGLHPVFLEQHLPEHLQALRVQLQKLAGHPQCCAVGEIGLDYFLPQLDRSRQQTLFASQLELAVEFQLPVLLHVRRAHADTVALLKRYRPPRAGIVHAFSGSLEEAREYIRLGFKLGFGGAATWPQAKRLRRTLAALPSNCLVLETDAPDMPPQNHAQQRNSPAYLPDICRQLAAIRGEEPDQLATACLQNSCELFGWDAAAVN